MFVCLVSNLQKQREIFQMLSFWWFLLPETASRMGGGSEKEATGARDYRTSIQSSDALPEAGWSKVTVKPSAFFSEMARWQSQDCSTKTA